MAWAPDAAAMPSISFMASTELFGSNRSTDNRFVATDGRVM